LRVARYDAGLVRRLQRAAKERAKQSGIKGFRKRWWAGPRPTGRTSFAAIWFGYLAIRLAMERARGGIGLELLAGTVSLAFAGLALQRTKKLRIALTRSFERVHSFFYPIAEREFVERTFFEAAVSCWWLLAVGVGIFRLMQTGNSATVWAAAVMAAIMEVLVVLSTVFALEEHLEAIPQWLAVGFYGMAGVWFFTPQKYAQEQQAWVNALPTGWVNVLVRNGWPEGARIGALAVAVMVSGTVAWFLAMRRRTRLLREFELSVEMEGEIRSAELQAGAEPPNESWPDLGGSNDSGSTAEEFGEFSDVVQPLPLQATWQKQRIETIGSEWGEAVRQGGWLRRWDMRQMPWIERVVGWWMSEKEKDALWFLMGGKVPEWSNGWKNSVIAAAVGVLLSGVLPAEWRLLGVLAIFVSLALGMPIFGGAWMATSPGWISGKLSPIYGMYPLGYGRASRVMAKVNLVRTAAWLPLAVVLTVVDAKLENAAIADKLWLVARIMLLWFAWMPIAIAGKFSKGTNDTTLLRASQLLVVPVLIVAISAMIILWGAILIIDSPAAMIGGVAAIAGSVAIWAAYGWWYNRKVDLLRDRQ
jgi:hypothetical protein